MNYKNDFLEYDQGPKNFGLSTRCQYALVEAIEKLSGGSNSTYIRHVLIDHVRQKIDAGELDPAELK